MMMMIAIYDKKNKIVNVKMNFKKNHRDISEKIFRFINFIVYKFCFMCFVLIDYTKTCGK